MVTSYEECIKVKGSVIQPMYPPVCVTKSGQRFTQEESTLSALSPTPDITANWKTYTNTQYGFLFKCPSASKHIVELTAGDGVTKPYYQEGCFENDNQVRITARKDVTWKTFTEESVANELAGGSLTPKDFRKTSISGQEAITYSILNTSGQTERYLAEIKSPNPEVIIGVAGFNKDYFDQILSTFRFIDNQQTENPMTCGGIRGEKCPPGYTCQIPATYPDAQGSCVKESGVFTCPTNGWVDCMPGPGKDTNKCSPEAMSWYKKSCPNFKGGAY